MSSTALDKVVELFPHPTVQPIVGQPSYETIAELQLKLNTNAASVHSNGGDGRLGLLYLTVKPSVYKTQSAVAFIPPPNPGTTPTIPAGGTAAQIADARRTHAEATRSFTQYHQTDRALKTILIGAIDEAYIRSLRDKYIGYANVSTLDMLSHLYDTYARITQGALEENDQRLKQDWDPNQPFEVLIDQIEDAVDFAAAGKTPYTTEQIVNSAYNIVFQTGLFQDECKAWRKKTPEEKTWAHFKVEFNVAHLDLRESQLTARTAGYGQANFAGHTEEPEDNQASDAFEAITQLANATTSDRETIAVLTKTNESLSKEIVEVNRKLYQAMQKIERLSSTGKSTHLKYCWSCGTNCDHSSYECAKRKNGHQKNATFYKQMGGATHKYVKDT